MQTLQRARTGLIAGLVATVPMTVVMALLTRRPTFDAESSLAPAQITKNLRARLGMREETRRAQPWLAMASHLGYGACTGCVYSVLVAPRVGDSWFKGPAFGLAVWFTSYQGWLPLANLFPAARHDDKARQLRLIVAHLVWGATTQSLHKHLSKREQG